MKVVIYADHLELRLKLRGFPYGLPRKIYLTAKERYFDRETKRFIAVKRVWYKGKARELAVVYTKKERGVTLITIHPLKEYQKDARIKSGRWQKL